jgi:hypothetical protein
MPTQPEHLCSSVEAPETFALEIPKVEAITEANVSPLAYFICGVGWSHFVILEVMDIE